MYLFDLNNCETLILNDLYKYLKDQIKLFLSFSDTNKKALIQKDCKPLDKILFKTSLILAEYLPSVFQGKT